MGNKPKWQQEAEKPVDKRTDLEVPATTLGGSWIFDRNGTVTVENETEALMVTAPGGHLPTPTADTDDPYEKYGDLLNDDEKAILDAMVMAGLSVRETARLVGLSPSVVGRIKINVLQRLKDYEEGNYESEDGT